MTRRGRGKMFFDVTFDLPFNVFVCSRISKDVYSRRRHIVASCECSERKGGERGVGGVVGFVQRKTDSCERYSLVI